MTGQARADFYIVEMTACRNGDGKVIPEAAKQLDIVA
jgi:hypothetical protein